jgi:hypothetical protein
MPPKAVDEAKRILAEADRRQVLLRLLGGTAVLLRCPSAGIPPFERTRAPDIDLAGLRKENTAIRQVFEAVGYTPNQNFNALHGYKQLMFYGPDDDPKVDVFLDEFAMCHRLDLRTRLSRSKVTLPLADLLFTKLQIVQINEKDLKDIAALLLDHDVVEDESEESVAGSYLARMAAGDWGIYTTLTDNLGKTRSYVDELPLSAQAAATIRTRIDRLQGVMDSAPKSMGWKLRAKIGRRMAWYELPDEPKTIVMGTGKEP